MKDNLEGTAVIFESGWVAKGHVGPPGTVDWAPPWLLPPPGVFFERTAVPNAFWKTLKGEQLAVQIPFFRSLNRLSSREGLVLFPDLFFSYVYSGNVEHLSLFAQYLDDWSMNSARDIEECPINIRAATELQVLTGLRASLRVALDERPELARDFPAETLARAMLEITENFHPYIMRAKRAELANWGIMGVNDALLDSKQFGEFRAMEYMNREMSRLARINWIQHLSLDGESLEAWDEGHMAIDLMLKDAPAHSLHGAPVFGDLERRELADAAKLNQRALLTHYSPDGNYWVPWLPEKDERQVTLRGKLLERTSIEDVMDEPEARRRISAVLDPSTSAHTPPTSDIQPYASLVYLRDGFGPDSSSLLLQNVPVRSQTQGWEFNSKRGFLLGAMRTQYNVARDGLSVLEATPILVNGKPPNIFVDLTPSGGKTDFSFQTPRHVQGGRFLSTSKFDVSESVQDSPYRRFNFNLRKDMLSLTQTTSDEALRDVRAVRQVFHLRSEGIFLIGDRMENGGTGNEFSQMFALPLRVPVPGAAERLRLLAEKDAVLLEIDPTIKRARSLSPGLANVSLYLVGHDLKWGGLPTSATTFEPVSSITARSLQQAVGNKDAEGGLQKNPLKFVSVRWSGTGHQALAAVVLTRPAQLAPENVAAGELEDFREMNGQDGVVGCSFRSPKGTEVWFQVGANLPSRLTAGPGQTLGTSLLVTRGNGELSGVVLGADVVTLDGRTYRGPGSDFAFHLAKEGGFSTELIRAPIDTTVIEPQQTVFMDEVNVSFGIPTQQRDDIEFHYTLDGSDPTLASPLYTAPFTISSDTLVKVRPFVKGLKETPWNIAGVDAGRTVSAIFRKTPALPAGTSPSQLAPGLAYSYYEAPWTRLVSHSGMYPALPAKASGISTRLLNPDQIAAIRQTDRAYAVKYEGYIDVPATGIYRFFAPEPLYNTTKDAGYDLRLWIDGQEWLPNPQLHAENIWSVALEKGVHRFQLSYVDFRWKEFRNEYFMSWNPAQMWTGTPVLEVDGPSLPRRAIPDEWLKRGQ